MLTSISLDVSIGILIILFASLITCQKNLELNDDPLTRIEGLFFRLYIFVSNDSRLPEDHLKAILERVNNITSQVNVHIQVTGYETNLDSNGVRLRLINGSLPADYTLFYQSSLSRKVPAPNDFRCQTGIIGGKDTYGFSFMSLKHPSQEPLTQKELIATTAAAIFWSNHSPQSLDRDTNCTCFDRRSRPCLSSREGLSNKSFSVSLCFMDHFREVVKDENHICLNHPLNSTETVISICGNGIIEESEACDCTILNIPCRETCDMTTCSKGSTTREMPSKPKSSLTFTIAIIILTVLGVIVGIMIFLFYQRVKKIEESVLSISTTTTTQIENF